MANKLSIHGRQLTLTDSIKNYTEEKISKLEKFKDGILQIDVTLSAAKLKSGNQHIAEILIYLSGKTIKATSKEDDLYYAIDKACDSIEVQLKKFKEKNLRAYNQEKLTQNLIENSDDEEKNKVVKVFLPSKPMEINEAILQLETLNKIFFTFINEKTGKMAVIYKRKDGDYGLIED